MALTVKEVEELRGYINAVMERADHHVGSVKHIALALTGAILWRKDDDEPIKVLAHKGVTKNVLWVRIGGIRYAFSYSHENSDIEMRRDSIQGDVMHRFSNSMPLAELHQIFEAL